MDDGTGGYDESEHTFVIRFNSAPMGMSGQRKMRHSNCTPFSNCDGLDPAKTVVTLVSISC